MATATTNRRIVRFGPHAEIEADLLLPAGFGREGADGIPIIVMAHGLGAVRAMGLQAYADRFAAAGYACLVFDYRHFGGSQGQPRHLLSVQKQREDWLSAIAFARTIAGVDPDRIVAWGTSFGGGHVIATAATRPAGLVAAIAMNPFTDGVRSALAMHPVSSLGAGVAAIRDLIATKRGHSPHLIPTVGPAGTSALMTAPDAEPGYLSLIPWDSDFRNEVPARAVIDIIRDRPGRLASRIEVPTLFAVCERDSVAPAEPAIRYAGQAPRAEIRTYRDGHFAIYSGTAFERVMTDQLDFLHRWVPLCGEAECACASTESARRAWCGD